MTDTPNSGRIPLSAQPTSPRDLPVGPDAPQAAAARSGPSAAEDNAWVQARYRNPEHARRYIDRWDRFVAEGRDIDGEARLIDAMAPRGACILDAGCGEGRVGRYLAARGHDVVGVDLDETLIAAARERCPAARWEVQNLARLDVRDEAGERIGFDVIISPGNVMAFLAVSERLPALRAFAAHLADGGRLVVGFGSGRGWTVEDFAADAEWAGLRLVHRFSSWDLRPAAEDFLVGVLERAGTGEPGPTGD